MPSYRRRHAAVQACLALLTAGCLTACSPVDGDDPPAAGSLSAVAADEASPRSEFEAIAERLQTGMNPFFGWAMIDDLDRRLAEPAITEAREVNYRMRLVYALLNVGNTERALAEVNRALSVVDVSRPSRIAVDLLKLRALTHLREAEVQNCIARSKPDCCIFPLRGDGVHLERGPALEARDDYLRVLEMNPKDLAARWLVNIVYMALGEYPQGVPPDVLIDPAAFASDDDVGRFRNIATRLGVDTFSQCGGAIVEDFDNDGLLDLVTSTFDPRGPLRLMRNTGSGFEDRSQAARTDDQLGGLNCVAGDYDNDGRRDILVLRGAWLMDDGQIRNSLLRNTEDGTFEDVTHAVGLADPARPGQSAAWGDFDNDGDLDLYVGNESRPPWTGGKGNYPSQLFRNDGDGSFTDVADAAGVTNDRYAKGVAAGDYDNDGDLDLYVSNFGRNRLYRNEGDATFTDVAGPAGVDEPTGRSFAAWFFDFDNDGWLDLFVAAYEARTEDVAAAALGLPHDAKTARLYRNRQDGTFEDITRRAGADGIYLPMGANFGDLDNDGWLDVYLGTGEPDYQALLPNVMLRNDGGRRLLDVTQSGGFGHLQKGHGIAFGDIDNDGDQDVFNQLGGFFPGDKFRDALFENPGHGNRFVVIKLVGTDSNRDAIGARIKVVVEEERGTREIHRAVGSVSSFGGSPIRQEIGLGSARAIRRIEVVWPTSGVVTRIDDAPLDTAIRIVEGSRGFERLAFEPVDLSGRSDPE